MSGFKNFILRGNLVDLAIAFIIGAAFATVVTAFTNLLLGVIAKIFGGPPNFDSYTPGDLPVGIFITALVAFLFLAAIVYFFVVVPYTKAKERYFPAEVAGPGEVELLTEIRDLLAAQKQV